MARELAAVNEVSETEAVHLIELNLNKGPKRTAKIDEEDEAEGEAEAETEVVAEQDEAA
jgi:CarD family transcriptional regulator